MKNLSAIPRLSLPETFTILITLVVCLAGFTEAEVQINYRNQDSKQQDENYHLREASLRRNVPYAYQTSRMTENESEDRNGANFRNNPELLLDKLIKRQSDDFGECDESDEKESDGYGYDDDEYYHLNFKRNDETTLESNKEGIIHDSSEKERQKSSLMSHNAKEKPKEIETIEMLNYKESHPNIDKNGNPISVGSSKTFSDELNRKKVPSNPNILTSLKMSDLREASAIDEKMKDRKDESGLSSGSSETKTSDAKKSVKVVEDKEAVKVKDSKLTEDLEQKEKETSLKDAKEAVVGKTIKETSKTMEDKEKGVKLSDSAKLEENSEKMNGKAKESDSPKFTREDTADISGSGDKISSDMMNPSGLNQISNRASFVSNDYKDNVDMMKAAGIEEDEKTSEDNSGQESNAGLGDYQDDLRKSQENLRKLYNQRDVEGSQNFESFNPQENTAQIMQDSSRPKEYAQLALELQGLNANDFFKKDGGLESSKFLMQQPQRQPSQEQQQQKYFQMQQHLSQDQQPSQRQSEMNSESRFKNNYGLSFPASDLENTEYHKNYIKSLKRYKSLSADQKGVFSDASSSCLTTTYDDLRGMNKIQEPVKRRSMEMPSEQKESVQSSHSKLRRNTRRDLLASQFAPTLAKPAKDDAKLTEGKRQEEQQEASRGRRKSPIKLEYEIKVINQNPQDSKNAELSHMTQRRFEKDLKTKLATEEKYLKKYPFSQVSRDDLTRLRESESEKKFKRKAPIWKRHDRKSVIQTRSAPSGYYSNRVKFGQKNFARHNDRSNSDLETAHVSSSYLTSDVPPPPVDKSKLQRSWEVRQQDYKHDPMKRYDDASGYMNKGNTLFLVRKGQRTATTFEEGSPHPSSDSNLNSDNLARILSKDNDYIVLKKTDNNKFQKMSESNPSNTPAHTDDGGVSYSNKFSQEGQRETLRGSSRQTLKNKGLYVRSFHADKDDKKFSSASHGSKSNLKKTFDKFRDLAGFFKDNEQESTDNQYSAQELKEGRDIVFSEDKLPDPIVISNDASGKNTPFNKKQQNSIYSISTNFKTLDQQDKKNEVPSNSESDKNMFTAEAKSDTSESTWEPALRNVFPEAKSINSMSKNGNEIIILDLNRNQLKTDHPNSNPIKMMSKAQQLGMFGLNIPPSGSNGIPNDNSIQVMLSAVPSKYQYQAKVPQKTPFSNKARNNRAYAVVRTGYPPDVSQVSIRNLADLPSLLRALTENKSGAKLITKRSPRGSEDQVSEKYKKFLAELNELSELNKSNYRKGKLAKKRTTEEYLLPPSSFPELSNYGDAKIKYLGSLLHNIMAGESPEFKGVGEAQARSPDDGISKTLEESLKSNVDRNSKYQRRWSTAEEKSGSNLPQGEDREGDDFLQSEIGEREDKNFQDEILRELAAASGKNSRLKREGAGMQKQTEKNSWVFTEKCESGTPSSSLDEKWSKLNSESFDLSAKDKALFGSEIKSDHEKKEIRENKPFLKSDYENHLNVFFENLNSNKNQKDQLNVPNENRNRKKRKENHRRKRSASRDVKNKVSTTAVQNTILKNLAEDNYQSVYSPGIKRRLFSTNNEADDADNYSDAYENDKNVIVEEAQPKCVRNSLNKCIDPKIVELFGAFDNEEEKNRARRSLTSGFHSNFKREIDLDESMPNDFQNFLVTSLGGFGSQNREVIKKDVALWERKESAQDANQIAESSPLGGKEDPNYTLEKREVPSSENRKGQKYFSSGANSDSNVGEVMGPLNHGEKKLRPDNKQKLKSKAEFADDKLPTQIRIQITNGSAKEKKSSKPIMDESETTSTEMENLPKEKEFFDKNKINTLRMNNLPKLHNPSKTKYSYSDYEENENTDSQGSYLPHRRRRKKKKYVPENSIKPIKDFIKFDQKTMETFLKKVISDQNMASAGQTTQKSPTSNHLPQVETVYNPTQGTNKAQLEATRFGKINSANNKNTGTAKNMQSTDSIGYDEGILRNYLKDKTDRIKSDKAKEFEDIDWKPRYGKMRLRQELGWEPPNNNFNIQNLHTLKSPVSDSSYSFSVNTDSPPYMNPFSQRLYSQKNQASNNNYFLQPSGTNSENSNGLYNALTLKQEINSQNALSSDRSTSKMYKKPFYYNNAGLFKSDDKERNRNSFFPGMTTGEGNWNYEYSLNKKPAPRGFKGREFFTSGNKNQNHLDSKSKIAHGGNRKFMKNMDEEKSSALDNPQSSPQLFTSKDTDYMDGSGVEDDYLDDDSGKEMQADETPLSVPTKYRRLFNSDVEDNLNEDEEEIDEDYDENNEEDDPDDYSLLANTKAMEPELTKNGHRKAKFQGFNDDSTFSQLNYVYPRDNLMQLRGHSFEQTEFNSNNDARYTQGRQPIALTDTKNDVDSFSSSTGLLKKANENANIFGRNLMKNTYLYSSDNALLNQLPGSKMELNSLYHHNKLYKRKMDSQGKLKRSGEIPQIGSRLFYASKTEINDNDAGPAVFLNQIQRKSRKDRPAYCRRNPFNAEFADPGNSFDESEVTGNDNFLNFGKNLPEENETDKDVDQDEDVAENLEDDGETISEDNVLENVIGKYIMRKRVESSDALNKYESPQTEEKHKLDKRSLGQQKYVKTHDVKIVKRLSSGHLTENNFRKYHKKNLTRKREVHEYDLATHGNVPNGKTALKKTRKRENTSQKKRSALDLFKKITNKDRDNKKAENADGRTAGFEPLSSLNDKKYESSIRDAKFEFLNQARKLSNESPQAQMKNSIIELKPRYALEDEFTAEQRRKEKVRMMVKDNPVSGGQGPWKIELNDKYNGKFSEFPKNVDHFKEVVPARQDNENLKAFLIFSNNLRAFKRSTAEDFSPTSGSSAKEVGNSYRPKSDEGRRISKMHVSKRSLDSSLVTTNDEEAAQTSRDHFTSEQTTETHVHIKEKNRALHDTKSLSEGDSIPQPPHVLQRNVKKIRSFVNDDEQCPKARVPPLGSLNNRMSVFPPSNDANIMRDSRQVNEETSKYLGQQIVDAILSHVSANPKLKELIAPGLTAKTTAYKEDIESTQKPLHQPDLSEQWQFFLQRFMFDLERLAEKHVRKRMCTQIDDQSKEFLRSLLSVPVRSHHKDKGNCADEEDYLELASVEEQPTAETTTEIPKMVIPLPSLTPLLERSTGELENLKKKHCLLLKLIDDYEKLTKLEQDSLRVNYLYLLEELEHTNKQLVSLNSKTDIEFCSKGYNKIPNDKSTDSAGCQNSMPQKPNADYNSSNCTSCPQTKTPTQNWKSSSQPQEESPKPNPVEKETSLKKPVKLKPHFLPTYAFEEDLGKNEQPINVTPFPIFESVDSVNMTIPDQSDEGLKNLTHQKLHMEEDKPSVHSSQTPQTFDLLPVPNNTQKIESAPFVQTPNSESIRFQQTLSGIDNFKNFKKPIDSENPKPLTELHKLSLGDAAGLQLSLKHRGPWVSNLDVAKTIRNAPLPLTESSKMTKPQLKEGLSAANADSAMIDAPSVTDVKDSRSLIAPSNEYSSYANAAPRGKDSVQLAFFPYFKIAMIVPKIRPFESVSKNLEALESQKIPINYYLRKVSRSGKKRVFVRSNVTQHPKALPRIPEEGPRGISKYQHQVPLQSQKVTNLLTSPYVVLKYPNDRIQSPDAMAVSPNVLLRSANVLEQFAKMLQHPTDGMKESVLQPEKALMQTPDVITQPLNLQIPSPDTATETQYDLRQPQNSMEEPSNIIILSQNNVAEHSNVITQPQNSMEEPSNTMMQPPDKIEQTLSDTLLPQNNMAEQSSVKMQPPDKIEETLSDTLLPQNNMAEQSSVKMQPQNSMPDPLGIEICPPDIMTESSSVIMQPSNAPNESPKVAVKSTNVSPKLNLKPPNGFLQLPDASPSSTGEMSLSQYIQNHLMKVHTQPPNIWNADNPSQSPYEILHLLRDKKPYVIVKHSHPKKNRLFAHFPLPIERKSKHKIGNINRRKKSVFTKNSEDKDGEDKDDELEYLAWSTMPAVRRQLNKLEAGLELDDFFLKNPKMKKMSNGERDNPI